MNAQRRAPAAAAQSLAEFYPKSKKLEIDVNLRLEQSAACLCWPDCVFDFDISRIIVRFAASRFTIWLMADIDV